MDLWLRLSNACSNVVEASERSPAQKASQLRRFEKDTKSSVGPLARELLGNMGHSVTHDTWDVDIDDACLEQDVDDTSCFSCTVKVAWSREKASGSVCAPVTFPLSASANFPLAHESSPRTSGPSSKRTVSVMSTSPERVDGARGKRRQAVSDDGGSESALLYTESLDESGSAVRSPRDAQTLAPKSRKDTFSWLITAAYRHCTASILKEKLHSEHSALLEHLRSDLSDHPAAAAAELEDETIYKNWARLSSSSHLVHRESAKKTIRIQRYSLEKAFGRDISGVTIIAKRSGKWEKHTVDGQLRYEWINCAFEVSVTGGKQLPADWESRFRKPFQVHMDPYQYEQLITPLRDLPDGRRRRATKGKRRQEEPGAFEEDDED